MIILSEGEEQKRDVRKSATRIGAAQAFARLAGIELHDVYGFPDQAIDRVPLIEIIQRIEKDIIALQPDLVYVHHPGDMNSDHQICAQAVFAALRPMSTRLAYPEIMTYETPSSNDQAPNFGSYSFQPNHYVRVDDVWERKLEALKAYWDELQPPPHPRSLLMIEALAHRRGAESWTEKAEAFMLVRRRWD